MSQIKIPRHIRKQIKSDAKTESGLNSSSLSDVEKSKEKASNKINRRYSPLGRKIGKILGSGKYNVVKLREGTKLDKTDKIIAPPPKITLIKQRYKHRNFKSQTGEDESKRFEEEATSSDEMESKVKETAKKLEVKDVGTDEYVRDEKNSNYKYNKEVDINNEKNTSAKSGYVKGSRTDLMDKKLAYLKSRNKEKSNRKNYREIKKSKKGDYRFNEKVRLDEEKTHEVLGISKRKKK